MADPNEAYLPEWWKLRELAARWSCSPAMLGRRCALPPTDPRFLNSMLVGKTHRRVHISEILRHEAGVTLSPQPEATAAPPARPARVMHSLLQRRMDALQRERDEAARNPSTPGHSPRRPRNFGSKRPDLFKRKTG